MLLVTTNLNVFGADEPERQVGFVTRHIVGTAGDNFEIIFGSNFLVGSNVFNESEKKLRFNIETGLEKIILLRLLFHVL